MLLYVTPFLSALITTFLVLIALAHMPSVTRFFVSSVGVRHIGGSNLLRVGGVAVAAGFFVALFSSHTLVIDTPTMILFLGAAAMLLLGSIDDVRRLSWRVQLLAQTIVALGVCAAGVYITTVTNPFGGVVTFDTGILLSIGVILTVLWIVGIINAINWSDGMHGLVGGITIIAAGTLFLLALRPDVYQPPFAIIAAALFGAALAFTVVNAFGGTIIAGTAGTYFIGFVIAVLAIFAGAKIGTALLVLVVPLVDALFVVYQRLHTGTSIFAPDTRHLHHRLLARGWKNSQILMLYYGLTLFGAVLALSTQAIGKVFVLAIYMIILLFAFFTLTKKHITS